MSFVSPELLFSLTDRISGMPRGAVINGAHPVFLVSGYSFPKLRYLVGDPNQVTKLGKE